jgi:hypothetical protein
MNADQIAVVLYNMVGFAALWGLAWVWRDYKIDKLRQAIFDLRAELFEYAATGNIDFNDYYYRRMRTLLNSMIRFAHELSFVRLVTAILLEKWRPMLTTKLTFLDELDEYNPSHPCRDELTRVHKRLGRLVTRYIFTTSIAAIPSLGLYFIYSVIKQSLERRFDDVEYCKARLEIHVRLMEKQAIETEELEAHERRSVRQCPVQV